MHDPSMKNFFIEDAIKTNMIRDEYCMKDFISRFSERSFQILMYFFEMSSWKQNEKKNWINSFDNLKECSYLELIEISLFLCRFWKDGRYGRYSEKYHFLTKIQHLIAQSENKKFGLFNSTLIDFESDSNINLELKQKNEENSKLQKINEEITKENSKLQKINEEITKENDKLKQNRTTISSDPIFLHYFSNTFSPKKKNNSIHSNTSEISHINVKCNSFILERSKKNIKNMTNINKVFIMIDGISNYCKKIFNNITDKNIHYTKMNNFYYEKQVADKYIIRSILNDKIDDYSRFFLYNKSQYYLICLNELKKEMLDTLISNIYQNFSSNDPKIFFILFETPSQVNSYNSFITIDYKSRSKPSSKKASIIFIPKEEQKRGDYFNIILEKCINQM